MAESGYDSKGSPGGRYRANKGNRRRMDTYTYIDGAAVRKSEAEEEPLEIQHKIQLSPQIQRNREKLLQMNLAYVIFLTAAAVITVCVCVNFLQLRERSIYLCNEVSSLEATLDSVILANDSEYDRVMNSVDLSHVKEVAIEEFGMQQASKNPVITYEIEDGDYVRQYAKIPTE